MAANTRNLMVPNAIGPISNLPTPLLSLLGVRGTSKLPESIENSIQSSVDVLGMVLGSYAELITGSANTAAVGAVQISALAVPDTEQWFVLDYTITGVTGAAEVWRGRPAIFSAGLGGTNHAIAGDSTASSLTDAAGVANVVATLPGPILIPPGAIMGCWVEKFTSAGNIVITGRARIFRVRR